MTFPRDREILTLRAIYDEAKYRDVMTFDRFEELLTHVGREVKRIPGQLRVTDRFDNELKPGGRPEWDSGLAQLALDLDEGMKRHKRKGKRPITWTVDEYLRLMNELY